MSFSPASAGKSQSDGVLSDCSTQRHSTGAEGETEGEEGGRKSLAEQQRGQGERGEETAGRPGEERQTHRGKVQESAACLIISLCLVPTNIIKHAVNVSEATQNRVNS